MRVASGPTRRHRGLRRRPAVECLEGRQLLSAAAGTLDGSFGQGRGVVVNRDGLLDGRFALVFGENVPAVFNRPDGKFLVISQFRGGSVGVSYLSTSYRTLELHQFNRDGSPDLGFGRGGRVDVQAPYEPDIRYVAGTGSPTSVGDVVLQHPDGKLLFVGLRAPLSIVNGAFVRDSSYAVFRTNADGSLDTSYGTNGLATYPATDAFTAANKLDSVQGAALQPDGKLILTGSTPRGPAVVRLDADGSLDTTFGAGGSTYLDPNLVSSVGQVAIQPDGGIVVLGGIRDPGSDSRLGPRRLALIRLTPGGQVDPGFGGAAASGGVLPLAADPSHPEFGTSQGYYLQTQADGKIVVLNGVRATVITPESTVLRRFNADGTPDTTFGQDGVVVPGLAGPLAIQPDGKLVIGANVPTGGASANGSTTRTTFAAARFNPDGTPDATFGNTAIPGLARYNLGPLVVTAQIQALRFQPDGSILLAGAATQSAYNEAYFAVARVNGSATAGPAALAPAAIPAASFDGTGRTNRAVYVPESGDFLYQPASDFSYPVQTVHLEVPGGARALPAPADFDGDGRSDAAVYVPTQGTYLIRPSGGGPDRTVAIGPKGAGRAIPTPADYDGDGRAGAAVYVPAQGAFLIQGSGGGAVRTVKLGAKGAGRSIPVAADLDGDGRAEAAVYEPDRGAFRYRLSSGGRVVVVRLGSKGAGQSIPVVADYTGDGRPDLAVYLPKQGRYLIRPSEGGRDQILKIGVSKPGRSIPVPGDYTGSGRAEAAVYDVATGAFVVRPAGGGPDVTTPLGSAGAGRSIPVALAPGAYLALGIKAGGKAKPGKATRA